MLNCLLQRQDREFERERERERDTGFILYVDQSKLASSATTATPQTTPTLAEYVGS